jgi:prevent-host-death family protein
MTESHSIAEARSNLPTLIRDAEAGKTVELTRHGEPVAVLVGRRQYERLTAKTRGFEQSYRRFTREHDLDELAIDPDEVFGSTRDRTGGREVDL